MNNSPLAEILRPKTLDDVLGQEHLTGKNGTIRKMLENDTLNSLIFGDHREQEKQRLLRSFLKNPEENSINYQRFLPV
jgi:AAA+ superfamily predicted ATPase